MADPSLQPFPYVLGQESMKSDFEFVNVVTFSWDLKQEVLSKQSDLIRKYCFKKNGYAYVFQAFSIPGGTWSLEPLSSTWNAEFPLHGNSVYLPRDDLSLGMLSACLEFFISLNTINSWMSSYFRLNVYNHPLSTSVFDQTLLNKYIHVHVKLEWGGSVFWNLSSSKMSDVADRLNSLKERWNRNILNPTKYASKAFHIYSAILAASWSQLGQVTQ